MRFFRENPLISVALFLGVFLMVPGFVVGSGAGKDLKGGITPASFFYFLDGVGEEVRFVFTFGSSDKVKLLTDYSNERIGEISALFGGEGSDFDDIKEAGSKFENHVSEISNLLEEIDGSEVDIESLSGEVVHDIENSLVMLEDQIESRVKSLDKQAEKKSRLLSSGKEKDEKPEDVISSLKHVAVRRDLVLERGLSLMKRLEDSLDSVEGHLSNEEKALKRLRDIRRKVSGLRKQADIYDVQFPSGFFMTAGYREMISNSSSSVSRGEFSTALKELEDAEKSLKPLVSIVEKGKMEARFRQRAEMEIAESKQNFYELQSSFEKGDEGLSINLVNDFQRIISEAEAELGAGNFSRAGNLAREARMIWLEKLDRSNVEKMERKGIKEEISRFRLDRTRILVEAERKGVSISSGFENKTSSLLDRIEDGKDSNLVSSLRKLNELNRLMFKKSKQVNSEFLDSF